MPNGNPPKPTLHAVGSTPPKTITGGKQVGSSQIAGPTQYDEKNFYLAATDVHHQKSTMRLENTKTLAFPPYVVAQVSSLVEDDLTPYRYNHDFIRDAVIHRLHYLQEHKQDPNLWGSGWEMAEVDRAASEASRQRSQVDRIERVIEFAVEAHDRDLYDQTSKAATSMVGKLRSPYKDELVLLLKKYARP